MSKFTPAEIVVLKRLVREAVDGMANPNEMFGPRQKPLTYNELTAIRKLIAPTEGHAIDGHALLNEATRRMDRITDEALKDSTPPGNTLAGLVKATTPVPERTKTSRLLNEAADMIHNGALGISPPRGQDWRAFVRELRQRATAFKEVEDTP